MYIRHLESTLATYFKTYKQALIVLGARQVGKTTLIKHVFPQAQYLLLDNAQVKKVLESYDLATYRQLLGNKQVLILDEIHLLSNPGRSVKIIYDQMPETRLIVTGSSSFHIKNKTGESLAGRKIDYHLYPLTFSEYLVQKQIESKLNFNILENILNPTETKPRFFSPEEIVGNALIYGLYPELINLPQNTAYLKNLADSVVFKDLLELNLIDNQQKAFNLLKLLAYQIGNLINYAELSNRLDLDQRTVKRYIDIFEQSFIIYRLYPYSQRARNEITKSPKIYFWDLGLRNAIIGNFDDINLRSDGGAIFENFIISEVKKINSYLNNDYKIFYWRLKSGTEIDLVIVRGQQLYGSEIKLKNRSVNSAFSRRFPHAKIHSINLKNFY